MLPPGPRYLARILPYLLFPALGTILILRSLESYTGILASWLRATLCGLSLPLAFTARIQYRDYVNRRAAKKLNAIIPPRIGDPTLGSVRTLFAIAKAFKAGQYPGDGFLPHLARLGNTFNSRILFEDRIVTIEPEHIKSILATQVDEFEKGTVLHESMESLLGTGVFAADGDMWKFHRTMTRPFFNKDRISDFDNFNRHADETIIQIKERLRSGFPVDFQDAVSRFTLDSASEFLFGYDIKSLSEPLVYPFYKAHVVEIPSQASAFITAFGLAQVLTANRARYAEHWPVLEFWKDTTAEQMKVVKDFLGPIVSEAIARKRDRMGAGEIETNEPEGGAIYVREGETLLDHLVNCTEDPKIIMDEIMNISVAGRDTTASTLTSTVYMLSQHPAVLARLREEIMHQVGPTRAPTRDDFKNMQYLRAVINETLRLYPPVPFNFRAAKEGVVWTAKSPGGQNYYVPPGVRAIYSVLLMHRREDLWGPDALVFDPDRFIDRRLHKYLTPNPFIFLPFNAGPRICLGQQFAYHEVLFFLVKLLQNFSEIALNLEAQPVECRPPPSWKHEGGVKAMEKVMHMTHLTMYIHPGNLAYMYEQASIQ